MKKKIYLISRIYSPLYLALERLEWSHSGLPAYYNFIKFIEKDDRFDSNIIFLLDANSSKKYHSGQFKFFGIKNKVRILNYISIPLNIKFFKKFEWILNRLIQYVTLIFILKKNSIYYLDRDNIILGIVLQFKKGLIVYRLLGITKKYFDIFFNRKILSFIFQRALKISNKLIFVTNDGSWAEISKQKLNDEKFFIFFNSTDFKKKKNIPKIEKIIKITCISRLEKNKGYPELIEIFSLLKIKKIKFKAIIIGDGSQKDLIIEKIHNFNLSNNVELIGNIEHNRIERYLENTDLFLSYNHLGMFGNNVIEASSKGIPTMVLDNAIINNSYKKYFFIMKKNSYEEITNFIGKFCTDINLRKEYSYLSYMFFNKFIGTWQERINKELDIIYKENI